MMSFLMNELQTFKGEEYRYLCIRCCRRSRDIQQLRFFPNFSCSTCFVLF